MTECFVGEIMLVPYVRGAPSDWLVCDGSAQSINNYPILYQLIGTTYGGDGQSTFNLPDLRGRVPVHFGQGNGLSNYQLGQTGGAEQVTLTTQTMPSHNHPMMAMSSPGTSATPSSGGAIATMNSGNTQAQAYAAPGGSPVNLAGNSIGIAGNGLPHPNIQPSLGLTYVICTVGQYPSQA
jgi:microcystin-dependent protein